MDEKNGRFGRRYDFQSGSGEFSTQQKLKCRAVGHFAFANNSNFHRRLASKFPA